MDSKQIIKGCEKSLAASEFKTDGLILNFLAHRFFNFQKFGGGGWLGAQAPLPLSLLRAWGVNDLILKYMYVQLIYYLYIVDYYFLIFILYKNVLT